MAVVTPQGRWIEPFNYFPCSHAHQDKLKLESPAVSALIATWSKTQAFTSVTGLNADANTLQLSNGKEFSYKSLVLAPGLDHQASHIKGLEEMAAMHESNNVFVHTIDNKQTVIDNYWHGWNHTHGDMICYSPAVPYKGEGTDFYALYYEHFLRQDQMQGRSSANAKIQFWTPNKEIF